MRRQVSIFDLNWPSIRLSSLSKHLNFAIQAFKLQSASTVILAIDD